MGRILDERRSINGNSVITKQISFDYNLDGSLATITYPTGRVVTLTLASSGANTAGRPASATDSSNINYLTNAHYAPDGELTDGTLGFVSGGFAGVTAKLSYNNRFQPIHRIYTTGSLPGSGELASASCPANTGSIMHRVYNFTNSTADNGNVNSILNCRDRSRDQNFTYDPINRIQAAWTAGPNWGETFTIDAWGNLTNINSYTGKNLPRGLAAAPASSRNQLNGYCHDAAGNLILNITCPTGSFVPVYSYDGENRLSSYSGSVTYTYDGDGNRVKISAGGGKLYWRGSSVAEIAESDLNGSITEEYVFFGGSRIARRDAASGAIHYYLNDHLGSTSLIVTATAGVEKEADYDPYGVEIPITGNDANAYKFTGKERDAETNLDYFGARYYGSNMGRWMSPDWSARPEPIPYSHLDNPQSLNLYVYLYDNPMSRVDLDGHGELWEKFKQIFHANLKVGATAGLGEVKLTNNIKAKVEIEVSATPIGQDTQVKVEATAGIKLPGKKELGGSTGVEMQVRDDLTVVDAKKTGPTLAGKSGNKGVDVSPDEIAITVQAKVFTVEAGVNLDNAKEFKNAVGQSFENGFNKLFPFNEHIK